MADVLAFIGSFKNVHTNIAIHPEAYQSITQAIDQLNKQLMNQSNNLLLCVGIPAVPKDYPHHFPQLSKILSATS